MKQKKCYALSFISTLKQLPATELAANIIKKGYKIYSDARFVHGYNVNIDSQED